MATSQGSAPGQRAYTALGYLVLFLLGAFQGLIGCFHYAGAPQPVIAIGFAVLIFVTCAGCGWGVGTFTAALLPAVGWVIASFVLASPRPNGSVIITATAAGEWYLYGGAAACAIGCVAGFIARVRRPLPPR